MKITNKRLFRLLLTVIFALAALCLAFGLGKNTAVYAATQTVSDGETFVSVIDGARGATTVRLSSDVTLGQTVEIKSGKDITVDLNGCNLTVNHVYIAVAQGASLTLKDGIGGGSVISGVPSDVQKSVISVEGGSFVFESGKILTSGDTRRGALTVSSGNAQIYGEFGGEFGVQVEESGSVKIHDGAKVTASAYPVRSGGNLEIDGGEITSTAEGSIAVSIYGGTTVVKAGTVKSAYTAVYNFDGGELIIRGGFFKGGKNISPVANEGKADISGGYFSAGIADVVAGTDYIDYDHSSEPDYEYPEYPFTVKARYIAQIDGIKYEELSTAFLASDGKTVKLVASAEIARACTLRSGRATLDLNGYSLTFAEGAPVHVAAGAELTVVNTSHTRVGKLSGEYAIDNSGTLNVSGGELYGVQAGILNRRANVVITGGFVGGGAKALVNNHGGKISVAGGNFSHGVVDFLADNTYEIINHSSEHGYAYPDYPFEVKSSRCGHPDTSTQVVAPTCTEGGYTRHVCNICGAEFTDSAVAALGHTEVVDQAVEATCSAPGLTAGKHCSVCNTVLVAQTTVTKSHSFGSWIIDSFPTAAQGGAKHRVCADCGTEETKAISAMTTSGNASVTGSGEGKVEIKVKQSATSAVIRVNTDATALRLAVFGSGDESKILGGSNAEIYVEVNAVESATLKAEKPLIKKAAGGNAVYFDLSLYKKIGNEDAVKVENFSGEISLTLTLPDKIKSGKDFKIVRVHGGEAEVLESRFNREREQLTFSVGGFSTYAIVYSGGAVSLLWLWILLPVLCVVAIGAALLVIIQMKKRIKFN